MKVEAAMILPSGEEQQMLKCGKQIADECKLISWKYSDKNTVMFEPEGAALTVKEKEDLKQREVIVHENTRFKQNPFVSMKKPDLRLMKTQGLLKTGKVGVDGKEVNSSATPSVNGFKFVPSTPSLNPDAVPDSPLMTWGKDREFLEKEGYLTSFCDYRRNRGNSVEHSWWYDAVHSARYDSYHTLSYSRGSPTWDSWPRIG